MAQLRPLMALPGPERLCVWNFLGKFLAWNRGEGTKNFPRIFLNYRILLDISSVFDSIEHTGVQMNIAFISDKTQRKNNGTRLCRNYEQSRNTKPTTHI